MTTIQHMVLATTFAASAFFGTATAGANDADTVGKAVHPGAPERGFQLSLRADL